jgi:hypothetical protein
VAGKRTRLVGLNPGTYTGKSLKLIRRPWRILLLRPVCGAFPPNLRGFNSCNDEVIHADTIGEQVVAVSVHLGG